MMRGLSLIYLVIFFSRLDEIEILLQDLDRSNQVKLDVFLNHVYLFISPLFCYIYIYMCVYWAPRLLRIRD